MKKSRKILTPEIRKRMLELYAEMRSAKKVARAIPFSETTVIRVLKEEGVVIRGAHGKTELERFLDYAIVAPDPECWGWRGWIHYTGYAYFHRKREGGGYITCKAYRWSYEHYVGPIPSGMEIDHLCRNRECVNPKHLEVVTRKENLRRAPNSVGNRAKRGELVGARKKRMLKEVMRAWPNPSTFYENNYQNDSGSEDR